ncbi:MAG: stage III sporulation protein AA [Bacteroidota bacterium]
MPYLVEESWLDFFPAGLRSILGCPTPEERRAWQEIRLRLGQPVTVVTARGDCRLDLFTPSRYVNSPLTAEDLQATFQLMTQHSVYALEEELRRGFITLPGGHRLGFSGHAILEHGRIRLLRQIGFLNLRLARAHPGVGRAVMPALIGNGRLLSTLILSPPRCGKTTLLRDLVRLASLGQPELGLDGQQVSLVDERSEVAGSYLGQPQLDVGPRTDVLDGAPKAEGMLLMLRAMSPEVLATDEIGRPEDAEAIAEAAKTGVSLLATAHAANPEEACLRPALAQLLAERYFHRLIVLDASRGPGTVAGLYEWREQPSREGIGCFGSWAPSALWRGLAVSAT